MIPLQFSIYAKEKKEQTAVSQLLQNKDPAQLKRLGLVEKVCIDVAMEVAKEGEGCLIVIGETKNYDLLFPNFFEKTTVNALDKGMNKVLAKLAQIDGAVIISPDGAIQAYGAQLKSQSPVAGHGTRHAAAKGISLDGNIAILASEEDKKVKIFKQGVPLVEINPYTKGVENQVSKIVNFINRPEAVAVTGAALGSSVLGIALLPGIVVFAGSYYIAKQLFKLARGTESKS